MSASSLPIAPALRAGLVLAVTLGGCGQQGAEVQPSLVTLGVSPLILTPAYAPSAHDYYVRCAAGANDLTVSYAVTGGATAALSTSKGPVAAGDDGASLSLGENELVTLDVKLGSNTVSYYIRCLPADFPQFAFSLHPGAGTPTPGWYLTGNAMVWPGESGYAMVLDPNGTPVWYERVSPDGAMNVDLQPDGNLSYIADLGAYGETPGAAWTLQSLSPASMNTVTAVNAFTDEHELQELPNGDWLITTYPLVSGVDLTGLEGWGPDETVADCAIQEISPAGDLVWQWQASDHIDPVAENSLPQLNIVDGVSVADAYHLNSIAVDATGNLLVSMRDLDTLYYIDKSTGTIAWKLGQNLPGKDHEQVITITGDPEGAFHRQHDARFQSDGCVSVFDDHTNYPGTARGVQYQLDLATSTAKVVWQYPAAHFSYAMGSFRRYPDGSSLIDWGLAPEIPASFTEVDDHGNDLLDVVFANNDANYRAVKVPLTQLNANLLRASAMISPKDPLEAAPASHRPRHGDRQ